MFKLFKDKLRDERGVTLLMALFALLVASMVCVVILSASVTSVKQAKDSQQQEQDTLMLQSAAKLVADDFADVNVERVVVETVDPATKSSSFSDPTYTATNCMIPKSFAAVVGRAIDSGTGVETTPSSGHFTVTATPPEGYSSKMDIKKTVDVNYIVRNASYTADNQVGMNNQLIFTFSLMPNDGSGKAVQRLYLKMSCDAGTPYKKQTANKDTYNWVTEYTWKNPVFYTSEGVG